VAVNDNAIYAYRYLMEKYKLQPHQAAGIVGNLVQESGLRTGARNPGDGKDGSDSIGIAQWNGQRARNLKAFGGDSYNTLDTQLDFMMHEMNGEGDKYGAGSERGAYRALMDAKDVRGATSAFIGFERPAGWSAENPTGGHAYKARLGFAGQIAGMTPEEIAAATASVSDPARHTAQATGSAGVGAEAATTAAVDMSKDDKPAFTLPKIFPDKVMGVDTKKQLNVLGSFGEMIAKQDQANNQAAAEVARASAARAGSTGPMQLNIAPTPMFGGASALEGLPRATGSNPAEIEELKKKMLMARLGGLGGLGGYGRV
jgi:hypothetical protein